MTLKSGYHENNSLFTQPEQAWGDANIASE